MDGEAAPGREDERAPVPPAFTQESAASERTAERADHTVEPFFPQGGEAGEPDAAEAPEPEEPAVAVPAEPALADADVPEQDDAPDPFPWEEEAGGTESPVSADLESHELGGGPAAPAPAVDTEPAPVAEAPPAEPLPVPEFLAPEYEQAPDATTPEPEPPPADATADLADRLERLAGRLREEGPAALGSGFASRDRLEVMLSGVLAGYLSARGE